MFERFSEKAIKCIMLAQEEARRLGHNFVGTEQILLGLIGEGSGIAARVLRASGVTLSETRVEVEKIISRGSGYVAVEIPFTPRAKRVLELSLDEAKKLDHNYIGTEHLLLGLLREGEGVASRVLENLEVPVSEVRRAVLEELGKMAYLRQPPHGSISAQLYNVVDTSKFTGPTMATIIHAREEARRIRHDFIGTGQLLVGLIKSQGDAAKILTDSGLSLDSIRAAVERTRRPETRVPIEVAFSSKATQIIVGAWKQATEEEKTLVQSTHLLLTLLQFSARNNAAEILTALGVELKEMEQKAIQQLAKRIDEPPFALE